MKKTIKIIANSVAIILVSGILFFANAFVGNPISKMLVKHNSEQYISENYGELNLKKEIGYSFKDGRYYVKLSSDEIKDLHFTLYYNKMGKLVRDLYENNITEGWNVLDRINEEYRNDTDITFEKLKNSPLFSTCDPFHTSVYLASKIEINDRISEIGYANGGIDGRTLELDKEYDIKKLGAMGGTIDVSVSFKDGNESYERGAEALREIKKVFDEENMGFYYIHFAIYNTEGNYAYRIDFFPYSQIDSVDLADKIKIAHETNPNKYDK